MQGEQRLKDFDIEQEAKGVDKVVKQNFTAIVSNKTLEIRFQYTGKGTTAVPVRGTYGPLISAISVESGMTVHIVYIHVKQKQHNVLCNLRITRL